MKKLNFLIKVRREGKLELVEPNEEVKQAYINKSESNLSSSKILLDNEKLEEAVSLAYYSMYHMLTALLFKVGIKCENHSASIILLKDLFELENSEIEYAKKERIDKQYYTDFHIKKQEVIYTIITAEKFNSKLFDFISNLNNQNIFNYRIKFQNLLK